MRTPTNKSSQNQNKITSSLNVNQTNYNIFDEFQEIKADVNNQNFFTTHKNNTYNHQNNTYNESMFEFNSSNFKDVKLDLLNHSNQV